MTPNELYTGALVGGALLSAGAGTLIGLWPTLKRTWDRAPRHARASFLVAAIGATLYGGAKSAGGAARARTVRKTATLLMTTTGAAAADPFAMPAGAREYAPWNRHGAVADWCPVDFTNGTRYVAFTGGFIRDTPRDTASTFPPCESAAEPDGTVTNLSAAAGRSRFWWNEEPDGTKILTWNDFFANGDTNVPVNLQLVLEPDGDRLWRSNEVARTWPYAPTNDPAFVLRLIAPTAVLKGGYEKALSAEVECPYLLNGTLTLDCVAGADRITVSDDDESVDDAGALALPFTWSLDYAHESARSFPVAYAATSAATNDIRFTLAYTKAGEAEPCARASATTTAAELGAALAYEDETFTRGVATNVTHYCDVADITNNVVRPFSRFAKVGVTPAATRLNLGWHLGEGAPDDSGELVIHTRGETDATTGESGGRGAPALPLNSYAELRDPDRGGVYPLVASVDGLERTATMVLPLAGADVEDVIRADLGNAAAFVTNAVAQGLFPSLLSPLVRYATATNWFLGTTTGYYRGRADCAARPTYVPLNAVNDTTGRGAVASIRGHSIRLEKFSNLLCGYTCERLGVTRLEQYVAQHFGTDNNISATASWNAGVSIANGTSFGLAITTMLQAVAEEGDEKTSRLWPNDEPCDNHRADVTPTNHDYNVEFYSPDFIYIR